MLDAATCAAGGFARETRDAWRAIADATRAPFLDRMNGALAADADGSDRFVLNRRSRYLSRELGATRPPAGLPAA